MNTQAISRQNRAEVTQIMPVVEMPASIGLKGLRSLGASVVFVLGAALLVWATRQNFAETFAAYYLTGMSTLYVVTRKSRTK